MAGETKGRGGQSKKTGQMGKYTHLQILIKIKDLQQSETLPESPQPEQEGRKT